MYVLRNNIINLYKTPLTVGRILSRYNNCCLIILTHKLNIYIYLALEKNRHINLKFGCHEKQNSLDWDAFIKRSFEKINENASVLCIFTYTRVLHTLTTNYKKFCSFPFN